jgi:hypothetical protein
VLARRSMMRIRTRTPSSASWGLCHQHNGRSAHSTRSTSTRCRTSTLKRPVRRS